MLLEAKGRGSFRGMSGASEMVVKLRAEERPVDLAFVRIMLALGESCLPTWLEGKPGVQ